jgi:hypothetical protein
MVDKLSEIGFATTNNAVLHWFEVVRLERERKIINNMVSDVKAGRATFESLIGAVSAISELRSVSKDMEQSLIESIEAETHVG